MAKASNAAIKREQGDACISHAEREQGREATRNLCRGEHCPNRAQCRRYQMHVAHPDAPSVSKCPEGKWFERNSLDHPQMRDSFARGC